MIDFEKLPWIEDDLQKTTSCGSVQPLMEDKKKDSFFMENSAMKLVFFRLQQKIWSEVSQIFGFGYLNALITEEADFTPPPC